MIKREFSANRAKRTLEEIFDGVYVLPFILFPIHFIVNSRHILASVNA